MTPPNVDPTPAPIDWYERRHELEEGMVFTTQSNDVVKLDRRVPGDGTKWYVADWSQENWGHYDSTIEPGDLVRRIPDPRPARPAPARPRYQP